MTFIIGIVMPNPRFESQTKRKLVRDAFLEKSIETFMNDGVEKFMRKNKEYLDQIMERARSRQRFMDLKDASKLVKKSKKQRIEKLLDANERRDRSKCTLFICEGDSAIGGLRSARDKLYQGGIALKGKPMNVSQASIKEVIENQEFADIMASIGLIIGQKVDPASLRYTKIVFLADSDVDGGHINTLLTNFFFTFWPELFQMNMVQVAKAPLFEVITDKGTTYCETQDDLDKLKAKKDVKIKEIQRNKGLGEMSQEAFKHVLQRKDWTKITVKDMKAAQYMLETCFGKESQLRKDLLIDSDEIEVDLDNIIAGKKARAKAARERRA
jgi:DNA gyrase/topoisomerase IV subunit B